MAVLHLMQILEHITTYFQYLGILIFLTRGGVCALFLSVMYTQNRLA